MQSILYFNTQELKEHVELKEEVTGYKVWVDLVDPTPIELSNIQQFFNLDNKSLEVFLHRSKKIQLRNLGDHSFALLLDIKYQNLESLVTEAIYFFIGKEWLITIHSSSVDLMTNIRKVFEEQKKMFMQANTIDYLYYNILQDIVKDYEQILTALELSITDFEKKSLYDPSKKMLEYLDTLSRQIIYLRRYFWHTRDVMNYLKHIEQDKEEIMYIEMVYDNITQLIELVESYRDTINSTRDLYIANVSLQMNDTMRMLTIFSALLLPLTFITSIFGMSGYDLQDPHKIPIGFWMVVIIMILISAITLMLFKKKQWILIKQKKG